MSLAALADRLPDYAKDLKLNLSSLASEVSLTEQQRAGAFVASALASRNAVVSEAVLAEFGPKLSPEALTAAKISAAIMAMNNIYYRFTHLASAPDYKTLPARLRGTDERLNLNARRLMRAEAPVDHSKAVRELGWHPRPVEESIAAAARFWVGLRAAKRR